MAIYKGKIRKRNSGGTYDYLLPETTIDMVNGLQDELDGIDIKLSKIKNFVTYEDFGATGNGVTNDWQAIKDAHDYANLKSLPIKVTKSDAIYYINEAPSEIEIYTDVDWGTAKFVIDDSNLNETKAKRDIFVIKDENTVVNITSTLTTLSKSQSSIDTLIGEGNVILKVENSNVLRWKRKGSNADNGVSQQESIHIKNGKVLSDILWEYTTITTAVYKKISEYKRKVIGGNFETKRNTLPKDWNYGVKRGIRIERSNVLLSTNHKIIEHNGVESKPYHGFIYVEYAYDVAIVDTSVTGHKVYYNTGNTPLGSYELGFSHALNLKLERVIQSNDINDESLWGAFTSNFCKDITINDSILSRIDCHKSLNNIKIIDSVIGYQSIQLNGSGLCELDNCKVYNYAFIVLREDYGATWDGLIKIKNSELIPKSTESEPHFVIFNNTANHDFGYKCYHPNLELYNILIHTKSSDNVSFIYNKYVTNERINYRCELDYSDEVALGRYPYIFKDYIKAKDIKTTVKCPIAIFYNPIASIYCDSKNEYYLNSDYTDIYSDKTLNNIVENFLIEIDNCTFNDVRGSAVSTGALVAYQANDISKGDFNFNNHRMIPKIKIKNSDIAINASVFPFVMTLEYCNIFRLVEGSGYKKGHLYFNDCKFGHSIDTSSYSYNAKNLWLNNVNFSFITSQSSTITFSQLTSTYGFFSRIQTITNNRLKLALRLVDCTFTNDIDFSSLSDSNYGVNLNTKVRKTINYDTMIRKNGTTSQRPTADINNGDMYYNIDNSKVEVFVNGSWV